MRERIEENQWAVLALLRLFLSITVVIGHYSLLIKPDKFHLFGGGYLNPLSSVFGFFVVSGFSIAASIDAKPDGFFKRRAVRIWPLYISAIIFGVFVYVLLPSSFQFPLYGPITVSGYMVVAALLMLQGIISGPIEILGPIWSLSAEWYYYLIAPYLQKLTSRTILGIGFVSFCYFVVVHKANPNVLAVDGWGQYLYGKYVFGLFWLWLTGFIYYRYKGTTLGVFFLVAPSLFAVTIGRSTGVPLFIAVFALALSRDFLIPARYIKLCNYLGDLSYPVYLFHVPVLAAAIALNQFNLNLILAGVTLVSVAALHLVDYPSRAFFKTKSGTPATYSAATPF